MVNNNKLLIFGQPFNNITGGGITLSNLFKGWPKDKIAVAATGHLLYSVTNDICVTYFQLGKKEHKWIFPLSLIQRSYFSGLINFDTIHDDTYNRPVNTLRFQFVSHIFFPLLSWLGILHCASRLFLSEGFKNWLIGYNPDILYLQVYNRETTLFAIELIEFLKIPAAIHFMDDWPSTISRKGIFNKYWRRKIDNEIKQLLDRIDLHFSISDAMSDEYWTRYKKKFIPFHNPVELKNWLPYSKTNFDINLEQIQILYSGRIGIGIASSLKEVAIAIDKLNNELFNIRLHIQTPTREQIVLDMLQKHNCVVINPLVQYQELPKVFAGADILLLANDFKGQGVTYLKHSMPTKASEYMISGSPVLVYAPEEAAVLKAFSQNGCGYCLHKQDTKEIVKAIRFLINNKKYRECISQTAVNFAKKRFDSETVRKEFQRILTNLS